MLTQLEEKILTYITGHLARMGYAPTLKEIGESLSIRSKGTVHRYVQSLIEKGKLERKGRSWRGLRLAPALDRSLTILPLAGCIETGKPVKPVSGQTEINFSALLLGPDRYVLKVLGNTMTEAGILDGDYVIVRKTETADNDDIVIALIDDGEVTLKRMRLHGDRIELIPANKKMLSLIYPTERVHIQGVVIARFRLY